MRTAFVPRLIVSGRNTLRGEWQEMRPLQAGQTRSTKRLLFPTSLRSDVST